MCICIHMVCMCVCIYKVSENRNLFVCGLSPLPAGSKKWQISHLDQVTDAPDHGLVMPWLAEIHGSSERIPGSVRVPNLSLNSGIELALQLLIGQTWIVIGFKLTVQ